MANGDDDDSEAGAEENPMLDGLMQENLVDFLQKYADDIEAQTGAPDPEIRAKIAELRVSTPWN